MSEQPEALRLAAALDVGEISYTRMCKAAAELRHLYAENERLTKLMQNRIDKMKGAGAPVGGPAGESSAAVVPAPARRLTDDEIGQIWFAAKIPGLTESDARRLIRAAEPTA
jgi:hypothetical protein